MIVQRNRDRPTTRQSHTRKPLGTAPHPATQSALRKRAEGLSAACALAAARVAPWRSGQRSMRFGQVAALASSRRRRSNATHGTARRRLTRITGSTALLVAARAATGRSARGRVRSRLSSKFETGPAFASARAPCSRRDRVKLTEPDYRFVLQAFTRAPRVARTAPRLLSRERGTNRDTRTTRTTRAKPRRSRAQRVIERRSRGAQEPHLRRRPGRCERGWRAAA